MINKSVYNTNYKKVDPDKLYEEYSLKRELGDIPKTHLFKMVCLTDAPYVHPYYGVVQYSKDKMDLIIQNHKNGVRREQVFIRIGHDSVFGGSNDNAVGWVFEDDNSIYTVPVKMKDEDGKEVTRLGLVVEGYYTDDGYELTSKETYKYVSCEIFNNYRERQVPDDIEDKIKAKTGKKFITEEDIEEELFGSPGKGNVLSAIGLTNHPFFHLPKLGTEIEQGEYTDEFNNLIGKLEREEFANFSVPDKMQFFNNLNNMEKVFMTTAKTKNELLELLQGKVDFEATDEDVQKFEEPTKEEEEEEKLEEPAKEEEEEEKLEEPAKEEDDDDEEKEKEKLEEPAKEEEEKTEATNQEFSAKEDRVEIAAPKVETPVTYSDKDIELIVAKYRETQEELQNLRKSHENMAKREFSTRVENFSAELHQRGFPKAIVDSAKTLLSKAGHTATMNFSTGETFDAFDLVKEIYSSIDPALFKTSEEGTLESDHVFNNQTKNEDQVEKFTKTNNELLEILKEIKAIK